MLSEVQRKQIEQLIFGYLGMMPSPAAIEALVGFEAAREAPASVNAYQLAVYLLNYVLAAPRPDLFIQVVTAVDAQGELLEVQHLVGHLRVDPSLWRTQTLDELWVPSQQWPFTDRTELRKALLELAEGRGPAAITIEAARGHGKQTMCEYIERLAQRRGGFRAAVVPLRQDPASGVLDGLVADLRLALGLELSDDTTHIEPERRAVVSARTLTRQALSAPSAAWLVANVIDTDLEDGVLRFIDELLGQVRATPPQLRRLRVVLLSDNLAGLGLSHLPGSKARYVLPEVDEDAIRQWLAAAAPGRPADLYAFTTSVVFDEVRKKGLQPEARLEWLARHCLIAHRNLARMS